MAAMAAVIALLTVVNLSFNNLGDGETGYVKATEVQGSTSFSVGDKVTYQGREMIVSKGRDSDGEIKMKPVDSLLAIEAIANALRVNGSLTKLVVRYNGIDDAAKAALREAVKGRDGFSLGVNPHVWE